MDMPLDQSNPVGRFLRTWRREIVRGAVLFGLVVVAGLAVSGVHVGFPAPWNALRSFSGFDAGEGDPFGPGREIGDRWEWRGVVKPTQTVWIRNTNGPIEVVAGTGSTLEVIAEKSWRHSQPSGVEIVPVQTEEGVTICALWRARERRCADGGDYHLGGVRRNDVAVRFTVKLPRGVRIDVSTVNGEVGIEGAAAPVEAATVNGRIVAHTSVGPVKGTTMNGSIEARIDALTGGDVELETMNGSITAILPDKLNAELEAQTMNGRVDTDFPLQATGKISPRHAHGTIGAGGLGLKLSTVNGSIAIRRASTAATQADSSRAQWTPRPVRRTTVRVQKAPTPPPQP
ncbi:MAG TPA: DUF4097 family beta strand repeat-containing protein [Gemmatimonadales bacterium]|jgi:hypothetical protein|nr:DUF4097 family beta strand repeat-containing protein [Gemmatimonadales bacterium]